MKNNEELPVFIATCKQCGVRFICSKTNPTEICPYCSSREKKSKWQSFSKEQKRKIIKNSIGGILTLFITIIQQKF